MLRFLRPVVLLSFILVRLSTALTALLRAPASCHDYVLISSRGTGEPQGPSIGFKDMIAYTLGNVTSGIEYDTVYPADASYTSEQIGADDIVTYMTAGSQACPTQRYGLLGYSQGAWVTLLVIRNITGTHLESLVPVVVTIGNPYQIPNQTITVDETGGNSTRDGTGVLLVEDPSLGFPEHWVESGKVQNICYQYDPVCDELKVLDLVSPTHFAYGYSAAVQNLGAGWLISHLRK